jgi:enamidase
MVDYWADMGATSFKAYMHITRAQLSAALDQAHRRGMKLTGHLCSITYREAAELGIDNLEHGFFAATDFVADKQPDVCPGAKSRENALAQVNPADSAVMSLIHQLVKRKVAITSTLTIFETLTPDRPMPPGLDVLESGLRTQFEQLRATVPQTSGFARLFANVRALELAFVRAGGLLIVGTDPTGYGGVIPGYANQRALELLVESGFTPLHAIRIGTLNGALYLGRDSVIGSIAVGKQADLVLVTGDPSARIEDIRNVELVFKQGVGYDPQKLIASVRGRVGVF